MAGGIGVLTTDKIGATLPVTDGVSRAQLKIAEGWVPQTASLGETGNAVIAGHRSYTCTPIRTATHRLLVRAQRME